MKNQSVRSLKSQREMERMEKRKQTLTEQIQAAQDVLAKPKKETTNDLSVDQYATIRGIRGKQFGREIFTAVLPFKDLMTFLQVFPDVQRELSARRVSSIKQYVLSGVEEEDSMRFFGAITATARGNVFYNEKDMQIAIDTQNSKLSLNDGQHRALGISEAIRHYQSKINSSHTSLSEKEEYKKKIKELENMVLPIVIFNQISEAEEMQLFFDINQLASRPSKSASIRLVQTDLISVLARELATTNKYLTHYGVEMDKSSIHGKNPNTVLLTTIFSVIKELYWKEYIANRNFLNKTNYAAYKKMTDAIFNKVFEALPDDIDVRGKYIIEKNYTLKGIAKYIAHCRNNLQVSEEQVYGAIKKVDWTPNMKKWSLYNATRSKRGNMMFSGGDGGIAAVFDCLVNTLGVKVNKSKQLELNVTNK